MARIQFDKHNWGEFGVTNFSDPALMFLYDYWNTKRGDRRMPSYGDIRASDMRQHLRSILVADFVPETNDFRYRVVGSLIETYFKVNGTNKTVSEAFAQYGHTMVRGVLHVYRLTLKERAPFHVGGERNWLREGFEAYETLYLPLSDDDQVVNKILSVFAFDKTTVLTNRALEREYGKR